MPSPKKKDVFFPQSNEASNRKRVSKTKTDLRQSLLISRLPMNLSAVGRLANPAGTAAFAVECRSLATSESIRSDIPEKRGTFLPDRNAAIPSTAHFATHHAARYTIKLVTIIGKV
jgi:hypothetical protein